MTKPHDQLARRGAISPQAAQRHAEMLGNRVKKAHRRWHRVYERQNVGAFRLYDRDIPEVRVVVDWYEGHVVVGEYERAQTREFGASANTVASAQSATWLELMGDAVLSALELTPDRLHLKQRRTRPSGGQRYQRLAHREQLLEVREGELRFLVNLDDYLDTGLFADHRETRRLVAEASGGRTLLNLYAYTGAFTCRAAARRAAATTTVDLSSKYIDWAQANLELNALATPHHEFVCEDVRRFLARSATAGRRWDVVVCDPPSFSTVGGPNGSFDINRDHPWLLHSVLELIAPGGTLFFSTNHQRFSPRFGGLSASHIEELTRQTVPPEYRNRTIHRCWRLRRLADYSANPLQ